MNEINDIVQISPEVIIIIKAFIGEAIYEKF